MGPVCLHTRVGPSVSSLCAKDEPWHVPDLKGWQGGGGTAWGTCFSLLPPPQWTLETGPLWLWPQPWLGGRARKDGAVAKQGWGPHPGGVLSAL